MKDSTTANFPRVPLSDVATVVNGGTPKSKVAEYWGGDVQWLTPKDMGQMEGREISETPRTITQAGLKGSSARLVPAGSVILSTRAPIGHLAMNTVPMAFNQGCRGIIPSDKLDPVYLYHFLNLSRELLNELGSGTTFKELSATNLKSVEIPLPPLEEQQRIVAVLDEAFEGLARARAHAEANLQNARELFSQSVETFIDRFPETQLMRLGDIVSRLTNGYVGPTRNIYVDEGIPYLLARHVRDNTLRFDGKTYVTPEFNEKNKKSKLQRGDVVLVQSGHIGHCAEISEEHEGHNCHAMIVLSPKTEILSGTYLAAIFSTPTMQEAFQRIRTGSTVPHLTCKMVKELKIPVMKPTQQVELIGKIREVKAYSDALINEYEVSLKDFDDLRQSLLQKAFAGELT